MATASPTALDEYPIHQLPLPMNRVDTRMGRDYRSTSSYDLTGEAIAERVRFGVVDHLARAACEGEQGWGMFEHGTLGRHGPTGFADYSSVA